jgi:hypothetical protein
MYFPTHFMLHALNVPILPSPPGKVSCPIRVLSQYLILYSRSPVHVSRCRAEEESHRLVKSKEESKVTDLEKKLAAQHARF